MIRCVYLNEYHIAVAAFTLHDNGKVGKVVKNTLWWEINEIGL